MRTIFFVEMNLLETPNIYDEVLYFSVLYVTHTRI